MIDGLHVTVERSRRRTLSLSVTRKLAVLVRAPLLLTDAALGTFVRQHRRFVDDHLTLQAQRNENAEAHPFDTAAAEALKPRAGQLVRERLSVYGPRMGLEPTGVRITSAKTRWGSCSGKNRLCFSARVALLPLDALDYIVVHELAHLAVKNHGPHFYALVARFLPDYRRRIALVRRAEQELGC